jgi:histidinol phosphatase-like enzyme
MIGAEYQACSIHSNVGACAGESDWREPAPGVLLDLLRAWPVIAEYRLVVGDKDIDMQAAVAAGLHGLLSPEAISIGSSRRCWLDCQSVRQDANPS